MATRRNILGGMMAVGALGLTPGSLGAAPAALSLGAAAKAQGRYFGAALRFDQLRRDPALRALVLDECSSITPEIHLKWDALRPDAEGWTTGEADGLIDFAHGHGLDVRGHALLWDQSTPAWARTRIAAGDAALVDGHIVAVMDRYADRVTEWDVVNEAVGDDGGLRDNVFRLGLGPDYVERALKGAADAAPGGRLAINDYGFEYDNPVEAARRHGLIALLSDLKRKGAPVHVVGLQAHLDLGKGPLRPELIDPFLKRLTDFGVEIAITELDVRERDLRASPAVRDQRISDEVHRYLDIVLQHPAVRGVTTWGLSDRDSWLRSPGSEGAGVNRGLPYDLALAPKPMRTAIHRAIRA